MGTGKHFDVWTEFPSGTRDPRHAYDDPLARQDFAVLAYQIDAEVEENADLSAMASLTVQPRFSGERAFLFRLDSNLRVDFIKDEQGRALEFVQALEKRDRAQSYGDYVTLVLADPTVSHPRNSILINDWPLPTFPPPATARIGLAYFSSTPRREKRLESTATETKQISAMCSAHTKARINGGANALDGRATMTYGFPKDLPSFQGTSTFECVKA
jgi:hypothetical protein